MSSNTAVVLEGITKRYRIGRREKYRTLRDTIAESFSRWRRISTPRTGNDEWIEALRDVSFEVGRGEVLGIIGRNGAGKSTLLKILARITEPTSGRAQIRGRMSSLLEVGTGFHPELSGRENIFLNAAILGMRRAEIISRFDEMVAFAEVERFLDTPVKHYSSGMYLRLAFAVAAHLEPEILVVDEVLAVGDANFQRKCLNKMQEVGREGRTVLFVSHNMSAVTRLCDRSILLENGSVIADGLSHGVVSRYLSTGIGTTAAREWIDARTAPGTEVVRLLAVRIRDGRGKVTEAMDIRSPVRVELEYEVLLPGAVLLPFIQLYNEEGLCLFGSLDQSEPWRRRGKPVGRYLSSAAVPGNLFSEGAITVRAAINAINPTVVHVNEADVVSFHVVDSTTGDTARGDYVGNVAGAVRPKLVWETDLLPPVGR